MKTLQALLKKREEEFDEQFWYLLKPTFKGEPDDSMMTCTEEVKDFHKQTLIEVLEYVCKAFIDEKESALARSKATNELNDVYWLLGNKTAYKYSAEKIEDLITFLKTQ